MGMISFNGVNYHNNGSKVENISEEEYQALVQAGEVDPNTIYFRYDGETSFPPVQNDGNATSLIDESIPTGQTIESVLNSNLADAVLLATATNLNVTGQAVTFSEALNHFAYCYIVGGYGTTNNNGCIFFPTSVKDNITIQCSANASVHYYVQNLTNTGCTALGEASTHRIRIYGVCRVSS